LKTRKIALNHYRDEEQDRYALCGLLKLVKSQCLSLFFSEEPYRKAGLSTASSHVESTVTMYNHRVEATEKSWSEDGAEEILQRQADHPSESEPLEAF
jgi:hypothetical protein